MNLVPILRSGEVPEDLPLLEIPLSIVAQTVKMYFRHGFIEPWIGYLAAKGDAWVGCGGFTAPPADRVVEIAYFTFPGFEGRGVATQIARRLITIATESDPSIKIVAHTLTEENASNHILKKLGFVFGGEVNHPEDGNIWEWRYEGDGFNSKAT
jgi:RimJ/RimL family protein N-acetyltransferase